MGDEIHAFLFDSRDYELLLKVNDVLNRNERKKMAAFVGEKNELDLEAIANPYLGPAQNSDFPDPHVFRDDAEVPDLTRLSPCEVIDAFTQLHAGYRITLNLGTIEKIACRPCNEDILPGRPNKLRKCCEAAQNLLRP
jgi:hypothetical protein